MNHPATENTGEEAPPAGPLPGGFQQSGTLLSLLVVSAAHDASETAAVAETRTSGPTARTAPPLVACSAWI